MDKTLKISVIVPSFNQGQYIGETIDSLLTQNYPELEIVVIDGGSTDETLEVIARYRSRINYFISEKDNGQSHAICKGLEKSNGEIITWLNSDDTYLAGTLERVNTHFVNQPETAFVYGRSQLQGGGYRTRPVGPDRPLETIEFFPYMRFPQPSSFFRSEIFRKIGINQNLHYGMDFELVVRALLLGFKHSFCDGILSSYRMHASSKTNLPAKFLDDWAYVLMRFYNSVEGGKKYFDSMSVLQLTTSTDDKYDSRLTFSSEDLENIFLEHLHQQYHFRYMALDRSGCNRIATFMKERYPAQYNSGGLKTFERRLKIFPDLMFQIFRDGR